MKAKIHPHFHSFRSGNSPVAADTVWAKVELHSGRLTHIGAYYRAPSDRTTDSIDDLNKIMEDLPRDSPVIFGGDFNAGDINWDTGTVASGSDRKALCDRLVEVLGDHHLEQLQEEPTREDALLDLYCTNRPGLFKDINTIPGFSDHHIVIADSDIQARRTTKPRRPIRQWSKADWDTMRAETEVFRENETTVYCVPTSSNWLPSMFPVSSHHPGEMSLGLPPSIRRMCRKKQRLFNKDNKTNKERHRAQYRSAKKSTTEALKKARWSYINDILQTGLDEGS